MTRPRITLALPLPPSINHTHGIGKSRKKKFTVDEESGRVFMGFVERQRLYRKPHYRRWQDDAGLAVIAARPGLQLRELPPGWYCLRLLVAADAPPDVDNVVKVTLDFLHWMRITPDDAWCWGQSAYRSRGIASGRCEATVWSMGR